MSLIFQLSILLSIWVLGLTIITQEGMLLYSWREWANKQGHWVEPIIRCHWCMPSIHGLIAYGFAFGIGILTEFNYRLIIMYPIVIMFSSLINGLTWGLHKMIEAKTGYYKSINEQS